MKTLFRTLVILALATWLGGLFFFPFLAQIAFTNEASKQTAGLIVGACLVALHKIGMASGLFLLLLLLAMHLRRGIHRTLYPAVLLLLLMLALTAFSQFWIIPHMESDRIAAGGSISLAPTGDPNRIAFERLHQASVKIEGGVLLLGIALAATLAWADSADRTMRSWR